MNGCGAQAAFYPADIDSNIKSPSSSVKV